MSTPLYKLKAEFFKTLVIRRGTGCRSCCRSGEHAVGEMLPEVGAKAANLSQYLEALRRAGLVTPRKEGSSVVYLPASPKVAGLLRVALPILSGVLAGQAELIASQRAPADASGG
jgi:ArsR family transcriptional regulator